MNTNDLLPIVLPFIAFVVMFFAWLSQSRKPAPVRATQSVRRMPETVSAVETDRIGVQVPA